MVTKDRVCSLDLVGSEVGVADQLFHGEIGWDMKSVRFLSES